MDPQNPQNPQAQRPKRRLGCLITTIVGVALVVVLGAVSCGAILAAGDDPNANPSAKTTGGYQGNGQTGTPHAKKTYPKVVFRVKGHAPAGVDITYGSDSDNRNGGSTVPWKATLKRTNGANMYQVTAQLNGGGDITCSVTIGNHTERGHASGQYQVCDATIFAPLGGWN